VGIYIRFGGVMSTQRSSKCLLAALAVLGSVNFGTKSYAATVTFDGGSLVGNVYTENGLQFALFGSVSFTTTTLTGNALHIDTSADVIITRVGGGNFSLDNFQSLGGLFTGFYGWVHSTGPHVGFHTGGNNNNGSSGPLADVIISLPPLANTVFPVALDARWGNINTIDWCGYCVTSEFASGSIDNLNFSIAQTPLPAALPLFATGLGAMGLLGWRRKRKAQAVA
jgi:hypothetical protein